MRRIRSMTRYRRPISPVDRVSVGEVLVDPHGLIGSRGHRGELDGGVVDGWSTGPWGLLPVVGYRTETGLVVGEGVAVRIWCRSSIDDVGCVTVEGIGGGIEGVSEVVGLAGIYYVECGSFEAGWKSC